jgi:hypothetical protein
MTDTEATAGHMCVGPSCWTCGEPGAVFRLRMDVVLPALSEARTENPNLDNLGLAQAVTKALQPTLIRLLNAEADQQERVGDVLEAARWVMAMGYPYDWSRAPGAPPLPRGLREAIVDVAHEDPDGRFHGKKLTRDEARAWLATEDPGFAAGTGL